MKDFNRRYDRQIILDSVGEEGQQKLREARVLIVGMGGLGCPASLYLAGAGVGRLGLLDHDRVDITNLHRQPLYGEEDLGKPKVEVAARKLNLLNSEVRIEAIPEVLGMDNAEHYLGPYDIVIDGTDNFETKYLINDACLLADKPWIYASVYKYQGQLSVFNYQGGPTYRCLFPRPMSDPMGCNDTGVLGVLPGIMGTLQAAEALKMILGTGGVLSGVLKVVDVLLGRDHVLEIERDEEGIRKIGRAGIEPVLAGCMLKETENMYLDVRESYEQPQASGGNILKIPARELIERYQEIPKDKDILVFCQSGARSEEAVRLLREELGFTNVQNVEGGIESITHGEQAS